MLGRLSRGKHQVVGLSRDGGPTLCALGQVNLGGLINVRAIYEFTQVQEEPVGPAPGEGLVERRQPLLAVEDEIGRGCLTEIGRLLEGAGGEDLATSLHKQKAPGGEALDHRDHELPGCSSIPDEASLKSGSARSRLSIWSRRKVSGFLSVSKRRSSETEATGVETSA